MCGLEYARTNVGESNPEAVGFFESRLNAATRRYEFIWLLLDKGKDKRLRSFSHGLHFRLHPSSHLSSAIINAKLMH